MAAPVQCRPEAYQRFVAAIPRVDTNAGLLQAAIAISEHAIDDCNPTQVVARLECWADRVTSRVRRPTRSALIARLHEVLFEEEQFVGDAENYYNPLNSYLPAVVERKRGIPITLSLVYKIVGERAGLEIDGINAPGHFLVRVRDDDGWLIVDPFHGGAVHSPAEAHHLVEKVFGRPIARPELIFAPATHAQWLARMLANLQAVFYAQQWYGDMEAMNELRALL